MGINRYDIEWSDCYCDSEDPAIILCTGGEYVTYEDHLNKNTTLQAKLDKAVEALRTIDREIEAEHRLGMVASEALEQLKGGE